MSSSAKSGSKEPRRTAGGGSGTDATSSSQPQSTTTFAVDAVAKVLLGVVETLRGWSDDDLRAFLNGEREIVIRLPSRPKRSRSRPDRGATSLAAEVQAKLGVMDSREEGVGYLDHLRLSRDDLRRLVAALDLPLSHADNMDRLRTRIVEALIGYRLGSRAIRGKQAEQRTTEQVRRRVEPTHRRHEGR